MLRDRALGVCDTVRGCMLTDNKEGISKVARMRGRVYIENLILLGDPLLRSQCRPVLDVKDREVRFILDRMKSMLQWIRDTYGYGRGLAAPQVGSNLRVVYINTGEDEPLSMINPEIISVSDETRDDWEGCLSIPPLRILVRRHCRVTVGFLTEQGTETIMEAEGALSGIIQHEVDHLDGILTLDRVQGINGIYLREEWQRQFGEG